MSADLPQLLIVEDDRAIARVLQRNLENAGFVACTAGSGAEATAALESRRFAFVLCDYELPDTTGDVLCRKIRAIETCRDVPIALCTAKAHEIDVTGLVAELNLVHVYSKPFSIRQIVSTIVSALSEPASMK